MRLPDFGMGCSGLGNLYRAMSDAAAVATLETAIAGGVRYFDTAPHYGFGLSEARLGLALARTNADDLVISTKVGRLLEPTDDPDPRHGFVDAAPFEPVFDYGFEAVLASHEASLGRLGAPRINLLLAHDLGAATHGADADRMTAAFLGGGYRAMRQLKAEGRIDAIGLGVNEVAICERLLDEIELDVILLAGRYTLLEQGALGLLDRCAAMGVRVIVGGPFNSGLLVETAPAEDLHYDYGAAPQALVDKAKALRRTCEAHRAPLPAAALRFPLAHPAVACVLPGLSDPGQVGQALDWRAREILATLWPALRKAGLIVADAPLPH